MYLDDSKMKPEMGPLLNLAITRNTFRLSDTDLKTARSRPNDKAVVLGVRRLLACELLSLFKALIPWTKGTRTQDNSLYP